MKERRGITSTLLALMLAAAIGVRTYRTVIKPWISEAKTARETESVEEFDRMGSELILPTPRDERMIEIAKYIANSEGRSPVVYDPIPGDNKHEPTIGIGHYMDRGDSRETFARVLPEIVDYDKIYSGRARLSEEQIDRLFAHDFEKYDKIARGLVPGMIGLPLYMQAALVDMAYRGDLGGSPKTVALINESDFRGAAKEYLNNNEYRTAKERGRAGIRPRMEANRDSMLRFAEELDNALAVR